MHSPAPINSAASRGAAVLPSLGWIGAALVLCALSLVTMSEELRASRQAATLPEASGERSFGLSNRSATITLERCQAQLALPALRLQPTPAWHAALEACEAQARSVIARWPTDARAWLLVATTTGELGDAAGSADALERSRQLAPAVQWLAQRRLTLADKAAALPGYDYAADVRSLLDSDAGASVLATEWVRGDGARRERIEAAAEKADAALQQRLLDKIRQQTTAPSR